MVPLSPPGKKNQLGASRTSRVFFLGILIVLASHFLIEYGFMFKSFMKQLFWPPLIRALAGGSTLGHRAR